MELREEKGGDKLCLPPKREGCCHLCSSYSSLWIRIRYGHTRLDQKEKVKEKGKQHGQEGP